jgi:hypothetical protein
MEMYRLCLLCPAGRIEAVQRYWAETDKEALTIANNIFKDDLRMGAFELWLGPRRVAAETRASKPEKKRKSPAGEGEAE